MELLKSDWSISQVLRNIARILRDRFHKPLREVEVHPTLVKPVPQWKATQVHKTTGCYTRQPAMKPVSPRYCDLRHKFPKSLHRVTAALVYQ